MEIISYKPAPPEAKYVAEIEVYYNRTFYRRIRLMLSQKGHYFINIPVYGADRGGWEKKWVQFWESTKDEHANYKRQCLEAVQPYLNKQEPQVPLNASQPPRAAPPPLNSRPYPGTFQPDLNDCPF